MTIFTDHDLQTIKPSELLRMGHEAYPEIRYDWTNPSDYWLREEGSCCPAMLIAHAAGHGDVSSIPNRARIAKLTIRCRSFPEAIEKLRQERRARDPEVQRRREAIEREEREFWEAAQRGGGRVRRFRR